MNLVKLQTCDKIADTVQKITPAYAKILKDNGFRGVMRYAIAVEADELLAAFDQDLVMGFVTYANDLNVAHQLARLRALGTPQGHHLFLDIEGASGCTAFKESDPKSVARQMLAERDWCFYVQQAGYIPGRYSGADQRLTGREQWVLPHRLYWHSCSIVEDRFGNSSVPDCDYAMFQDHHFNQQIAPGYVIDVNEVRADKNGRTPILVGG